MSARSKGVLEAAGRQPERSERARANWGSTLVGCFGMEGDLMVAMLLVNLFMGTLAATRNVMERCEVVR